MAAIPDVACFRDVVSIRPGDEWRKRIREGLRDSTHLVLILSHAALNAEWVHFEVGFAQGQGVRVIPYASRNVRDSVVPSYLAEIQLVRSLKKLKEYFESEVESRKNEPQCAVYQAAFLWHGQSPPPAAEHFSKMTPEIEATKQRLHEAIDSGVLDALEIRFADGLTRILSRSALQKFARARGERPAFLFDEEP